MSFTLICSKTETIFLKRIFFCSFNFFFWTSLSSNGNDSIFFFSCVHTAVNRFRSESTTRSYVLADDRGCNARLLLKSIALCVCLSLSPSLHCVSGDECEMIFYADDRRVSEIFFYNFWFFLKYVYNFSFDLCDGTGRDSIVSGISRARDFLVYFYVLTSSFSSQ